MKRLSEEEMLEMPISAVVDGWKLKDGGLYLFVQTAEHTQQTIILKTGKS